MIITAISLYKGIAVFTLWKD